MGEYVRIGPTIRRGAAGLCGALALAIGLPAGALAQDESLPPSGDVTYDHFWGFRSGANTVRLNRRESAAARHLLKTGAIEIGAGAPARRQGEDGQHGHGLEATCRGHGRGVNRGTAGRGVPSA